ncbi:rRNA pseudouridine synthase [Candidatus Woesebacteria bacterium]|nr:rRNA pseudouridine synthase [Candidatus Woesebacteria bacterium]
MSTTTTTATDTIKLHAYLAHRGIASRRAAEELIKAGKVTVNGAVAQIGQRINPAQDQVAVEGKIVTQNHEPATYILVYKPPGIISTTADELDRNTVLDLIPRQSVRLYPVGRLDKESEGLMLLTNDGELAQKLTHPRYHFAKTYQVQVAGKPTLKALDHLRRGVKLKEGYTQPAEVQVLNREEETTWLSITIYEGRNRQVRRMLERVGYETLRLIRETMGPFSLDDLLEQPYRILSTRELQQKMTSLADSESSQTIIPGTPHLETE